MIHLYIGSGKGKTTAGLGLCVRAAGWGKKVYIAQFLKDKRAASGEVKFFSKNRLLVIERFPDQTHPFFLSAKQFDREALVRSMWKALVQVSEKMQNRKFDVIMLDEILSAVEDGFLQEEALLELIQKCPATCELILTGRSILPKIIKRADYVSKIMDIKHPWKKGIKARRGIEF